MERVKNYIKKNGLIIGILIFLIVIIGIMLMTRNEKKEEYYQVIFDSSGGTEVAGQNILFGEKVKYPIETSKEGYIFDGWYLNDKKFDFNTVINKDIILTAKWKKEINESNNEISEGNDKKEQELEKEKVENDDKKKEDNNNTSQNQQSASKNNNVTEKQYTNNQNQETNQTKTTTVDITNVTLNTNQLSLKVGEISSLTAYIQPTNATNKNIVWYSSNNGVVTVSNGSIRAVGPGTATITATAGGKSASCTVNVTKNITYSYEIIDIPSSAVGQCNIYIKSSEGQYVSGTITIVYTNGTSETLSVSPNGVMRVRNIISSVTVVSAG